MCLTCVPSSWARVALLKSSSSLRPSQCSFHKAKHRLNLYHSPYVSRIFWNLLILFQFCQYFEILTSGEYDVSSESGNSWEFGDSGDYTIIQIYSDIRSCQKISTEYIQIFVHIIFLIQIYLDLFVSKSIRMSHSVLVKVVTQVILVILMILLILVILAILVNIVNLVNLLILAILVNLVILLILANLGILVNLFFW